jgi:plastocyanin
VRWIVSISVIVVCITAGWVWFENQRTHTVVITGTTALDIPAQITLIAGLRDTLIIRNETDGAVLLVGRSIAPRQQIRQRYRTPGTYTYVCASHGGATMDVVVLPFDAVRWLKAP